MNKIIEKIISGACIGADMAGLYAAEDMGIPTGGYNWNQDVRNGELKARFGINPAKDFPFLDTNDRTTLNVIASDCTLHFAHAGEKVTLFPLERWRRPYMEIRMDDYSDPTWLEDSVIEETRDFLRLMRYIMRRPLIVNIAGNADTKMEPLVREFMCVMLEPLIPQEAGVVQESRESVAGDDEDVQDSPTFG